MDKTNGLDEVDIKIIKLLEKNGRLSNRNIASLVGISEPTVRRKIKRLFDEEFIEKFTIILTEKGKLFYSNKN